MKIRILLIISVVILALLWWKNRVDNAFKMIFCDVGQGDAALMVLGNFQMMIDVGPENRKVLRCLENNLPFGDRKIEVVVVTHWDLDHAGGLRDILKYYEIEKLFSGAEPGAEFEQINYTDDLVVGDVIKYDLIIFEILSTEGVEGKGVEGDNNNSVVGLLSYKDYKFFMMGDAPKEVEQRLVWRGVIESRKLSGDVGKGGKVVLKVSHHGSDTGTSKELLDMVRPDVAIVSVGNNTFGHPTKEVLDKIRERGVQILRTDLQGEIKFVVR